MSGSIERRAQDFGDVVFIVQLWEGRDELVVRVEVWIVMSVFLIFHTQRVQISER